MTKRRSCHVDVFLPLPSSSPHFPSLNLSSPPIRRPWIAWPNSLKLLKDLVCCSPVPGPSNVDTSFTTVTVPTGRPGPTSIAIPIHDPARAAKPVAPHTSGNPGLLHPHCLPHATPLTPPSSLTTVKNNIYHENQGATRKSYPSQVNCSLININSTSNLTASAHAAGMHVVTGAGNDDEDACDTHQAIEPVVVGAIDINDRKGTFSNFGQCVDVWAPGEDIIVADSASSDGYLIKTGTSLAAPLVSGMIALIIGKFISQTTQGDMPPDDMKAKLISLAKTPFKKPLKELLSSRIYPTSGIVTIDPSLWAPANANLS
ncbi:peptidase S8/S53 domain-containing protein [Mycena vitilis]|nr:peptidase S8/S53 domain-containing protein [Mycena vitilis]